MSSLYIVEIVTFEIKVDPCPWLSLIFLCYYSYLPSKLKKKVMQSPCTGIAFNYDTEMKVNLNIWEKMMHSLKNKLMGKQDTKMSKQWENSDTETPGSHAPSRTRLLMTALWRTVSCYEAIVLWECYYTLPMWRLL